MEKKLTALVLGTVRHSDRANVVTLYTLQSGSLSCISPVSTGRGARLRAARLMPLSVIETEMRLSAAAPLQRLNSFRLLYPYSSLYFHPLKNAITLFLSEFLGKYLRESAADAQLFEFLTSSLLGLDGEDDERRIARFPTLFLSRLLRFAGLQPNVDDYGADRLFDMRAGRFVEVMPPHRDCLAGDELRLPLAVAALADGDEAPECAPANRQLLDFLLRYYRLHLPGLDSIRSPEILHMLF